jgi:hypothetical protein
MSYKIYGGFAPLDYADRVLSDDFYDVKLAFVPADCRKATGHSGFVPTAPPG